MEDYMIYKLGKLGTVIVWITLFITGIGFAYYMPPSFIGHKIPIWETIPGALVVATLWTWLSNKAAKDIINYNHDQDLPENILFTLPCDFHYESDIEDK